MLLEISDVICATEESSRFPEMEILAIEEIAVSSGHLRNTFSGSTGKEEANFRVSMI